MTDKKPLEPKAGTPSQNDRLNNATDIQSPVMPEDYPADEREGQTVITGKEKPQVSGGKP